jgi:3-hydroxyacyl-[acyl-carrier-protein] dehydratase
LRFLLVDRYLEVTPARVVATTRFDPALPVFEDHFPGVPLVPGVLLIEAMGQAAGWAVLAGLHFERLVLLAEVEHAAFRRPVRPGLDLRIEAELGPIEATTVRAAAVICAGSRTMAEARLRFTITNLPADRRVAERLVAWARTASERMGLVPTAAATPSPGDHPQRGGDEPRGRPVPS